MFRHMSVKEDCKCWQRSSASCLGHCSAIAPQSLQREALLMISRRSCDVRFMILHPRFRRCQSAVSAMVRFHHSRPRRLGPCSVWLLKRPGFFDASTIFFCAYVGLCDYCAEPCSVVSSLLRQSSLLSLHRGFPPCRSFNLSRPQRCRHTATRRQTSPLTSSWP